MNAEVIQLTQQALWFVLLLSAPPIVLAAIVGLLVAFVQAATQLQEQTLPYLLKFVVIVLTLFMTASLLGGGLYQYADRVFSDFASLVTKR
ncbi:type III secretion system export apparatus subunit SctS [Roseateles sp.]|uniref:type III secretion system export apparatus subunit SctS n=1 Tax=Roseateles sp. TaxID=1971397 RepID=UPI0031D0A339